MEVLKNSEKRWLRYDFSAVETHDLSMQLANRTQEKVSAENEKKSAMAQFKSQIDSIVSEVNSLSNKVANGYEMRNVECSIKYHLPEQGKKTILRTDTNEKIVEKMTSEEWNLFNQEKDTDHQPEEIAA